MKSLVVHTNTARYWIESKSYPLWDVEGVCPLYGDETPNEVYQRLESLSFILGEMPEDIVIGWEPQ